jgi:Cdc6-like AAA superfamily ATPase
MKYYETSFDEYIKSVEKYNIHPELEPIYKSLPDKLQDFENMIIYGPSGTGKYSQFLYMLKRYSSSQLKYDKRITAVTDKQTYIYHISDIHYEVDMSLLGCNSKTVWSEIFFQIVDIISIKPNKIGVILCKNFHLIHSELLDVFYSYIQQYNHSNTHLFIKFVLITDSISFIPNNIVNVCQVVRVERPTMSAYLEINKQSIEPTTVLNKIMDKSQNPHITTSIQDIFSQISTSNITNIKELNSFQLITNNNLPDDIFNIVCDKIIIDMENIDSFNYIEFRDSLYNILTYNLDTSECVWYILFYFIRGNTLSKEDITKIIERTYIFFKYYNNNYRPIYHLESIMFYIINKVNKFDEL